LLYLTCFTALANNASFPIFHQDDQTLIRSNRKPTVNMTSVTRKTSKMSYPDTATITRYNFELNALKEAKDHIIANKIGTTHEKEEEMFASEASLTKPSNEIESVTTVSTIIFISFLNPIY